MTAVFNTELRAQLLAMLPTGTGQSIATTSPLDGSPIAQVPTSSNAEITTAFAKARAAQIEWQRVPLRKRIAILNRFHKLVLANRELLCDVVQIENGKARGDAHNEVLDIAQNIRYYTKVAPNLLAKRPVPGAFPIVTIAYEEHLPIGVVGLISPWNYPLCIGISDAIPAILAGNSIVWKPDQQTMFSALLPLKLWIDAGLPADLIQVVAGEGPEVGPQIVEQADFVMFTGSTAVGRGIGKRTGERLIGCSLELGGKNSLIVLPDANVKKAAKLAVIGAFSNSGQLCIGTERIVVHQNIAAEFEREFVQAVEAMKLGATVGWGADMGPVISTKQLARIETQVADAVGKGARVLTGGKRLPEISALMYAPTVLADVTNDMDLCSGETFGPVCALYTWHDEKELLEFVNNTGYGLAASVIGKSKKACMRIAAQLQAGGVSINDPYGAAYATIAATMGGFKDSGLGRRHGAAGMLKFTETRTIARQRFVKLSRQLGLSDAGWARVSTMLVKVLKGIGMQ